MNIHEDFTAIDGSFEQLLPHVASREDMLCSEEIRLKFDLLNQGNSSGMLMSFSSSWLS